MGLLSIFAVITFRFNPRAWLIDLEYYQIIVLLLLLNVKLIPSFTEFFSYMSYSLLGFQFTGLKNIISINTGDKQENEMLFLLNFLSTSTLSNIIFYLLFCSSIVVAFVIIKIVIQLLFQLNKCIFLTEYAKDKLNVIFLFRILVRCIFLG